MVEAGHDGQMGLTTSVCGNDGSGVRGGGDIRTLPLEYHCPVYRNLSDTGAMSGCGEMVGGASETLVVGKYWNQPWTRGREGGGGGGEREDDT